MITCDECGRENDDEYKFCLGCGAALEQSDDGGDDEAGSELINCPFCGAEQPMNFKFCGSCGEQIPDSIPDQGGGEASESGNPATSSGGPGGAQAADGGGQPNTNQPGDSGAGPSAPATAQAAQSQPGTAAAAGDQGDPPPMPSDVAADSGGAEGAGGAQPQATGETVAELIVIRPDGTEGASIDLPKDKLSIGRASELDALSGDPFLSPKHASILYDGGTFTVTDDGSLNGIFREVTDSVELDDGDLVRIGQELLEFERFDGEPGAGDGDPPLAAGSPEPGYWGRLRLIAGPEVYTEAYALDEQEVTIGRETGDIVFKDDGFVSGTHARISFENGKVILSDLNSSNGTFLRIRGDHQIADGERVLMGQQLFRLEVK